MKVQKNNSLNSYATKYSIPERGQLVEVRRRKWIVSDIQGSIISNGYQNEQHLVTLSSLDEDSLGEELRVIWQLEPGARVLEKTGLPQITGIDSADKLEAFLNAVRWGAVTNADRQFLQAPFRSGISIEDYQLDPLVRAIDMARVNLLIADDVGLGKTIEAGLIIQELLVRHRARTVFIICPASLQIKWQTEMHEKFGLEFRIVDTAYIKQLRRERGIHANPWTSFPRLITSMDWMKSGEGLRLLKNILPLHASYPRKFDILVVDEAHNIAPGTATHYAIESQRTRLIRTISSHFEHRLFLSATPHNGYQESFTTLLELLDNQRFARTVMPDEKQLHRVMVRRLKTDLVDSEGKPIYPIRQLLMLEVNYSNEEREIHKLLQNFIKSREENIKGTRYEFGAEFVHKLLKKRLFSSPMAFTNTLIKYKQSLSGIHTRKKQDLFDDRILHKAILRSQEEYLDDTRVEEIQNEAIQTAGELLIPLKQKEYEMIDKLLLWAEKSKHSIDAKATAILNWLEEYLKSNGKWNNKRVILFTEYRATHVWMEQILISHGFGGDRLMILHGGMRLEEREQVKAAFQANPDISPVRILLATDAASEGIDLQNYCNYLIHIEIPWNPNVMEQRNGRIDRHGQKESEVFIWHPVGSKMQSNRNLEKAKEGQADGDHEYLWRAVQKVNNIRQDLGSVGPVIARQIEEAMLGQRHSLDTKIAEIRAERARQFMITDLKLQNKIARLHDRLMESKTDFHLSPDQISKAVDVALNLAAKPPLKPTKLSNLAEGKVYDVPILPGSWGRATIGLEHPHTGEKRPITFDHEVAKGRDDVVLAHLNHPLVQMCLRLLREELWKMEDVKKLHRVAMKFTNAQHLKNPIVGIWSRLVITGGCHYHLHEEITLSGGEMKPTGFARIPQIGKLESIINSAKSIEINDELLTMIKERYTNQNVSIQAAIDARSQERLKHLKNTLRLRKESEQKDILNVLDELEKSIKIELEKYNAPMQLILPGFEEDERNQIRRNLDELKNRLVRIPEEKMQEKFAIEKRYEGLIGRTFPVAVEFIIPCMRLE